MTGKYRTIAILNTMYIVHNQFPQVHCGLNSIGGENNQLVEEGNVRKCRTTFNKQSCTI